jgi:hypothetical protein
VSEDRIWQVKLPDGSVWIPEDSRADDPRRSWIYSRSIADMFANEVGGTVIEVTRRQKESVLDKEIAFALNEPKPAQKPKSPKPPKLRTRPFSRTARHALATAILENVPLNNAARSALVTAREAADDNEYNAALRTLKAGLPAMLWIGYDPDSDFAMVNTVAPVWVAEDPQGEDPRHWMEVGRDAIASILVEGA